MVSWLTPFRTARMRGTRLAERLRVHACSKWLKAIPWDWYETLIKKVESEGSRRRTLGNIIYRTFFRRITRKEVPLCDLRPGDRVIQIGIGSLPQTVLYLAELGANVEALDNDPAAVANASRFLEKFSCDGRVSVRQADGLETDCAGADAVWISFVVYPKDKVLKRAFASLKAGGRLVYRNPTGLLSHIIPELRVEPDGVAPLCPVRTVKYFPGMETVVITKTPDEAACLVPGEQQSGGSVAAGRKQ
ncbi:MAG: SAM-dependent methyltransferase [Dehalococcoidia bacterium]